MGLSGFVGREVLKYYSLKQFPQIPLTVKLRHGPIISLCLNTSDNYKKTVLDISAHSMNGIPFFIRTSEVQVYL